MFHMKSQLISLLALFYLSILNEPSYNNQLVSAFESLQPLNDTKTVLDDNDHKAISFNLNDYDLDVFNKTNCEEVECDLNIVCGKDSTLTLVNDSCCPSCVCNACPDLNYDICTNGFKPVKQLRSEEFECCDSITCISDPDSNEDLTINIEEKYNQASAAAAENEKHHTYSFAKSGEVFSKYKTSKPSTQRVASNEFMPSNIDEGPISGEDMMDDEDGDGDGDENDDNLGHGSDGDIYSDDDGDLHEQNDLNENYNLANSQICQHLNCLDDKYTYLKDNSKCPDDSSPRELDKIEQTCCNVKQTCVCNKCESHTKMVDWCKFAGNNFEPILLQKGDSIPGKCCNVYICHSSNFTCNLNGEFYPHDSEWKLNACTSCKCDMGLIKCNKIQCPVLDCEVKQSINSECCPVCTGECQSSSGTLFKSNDTWKENDDCIECKCVNGKKQCVAESCEPTYCKNPIKRPGICCRVCEKESITKRKFFKYPPHCKSKLESLQCNLTCKYGLRLDGNRCPICKCSDEPIEKCSFHCDVEDNLAFMPLNDRFCECTNDCKMANLEMNSCNLICTNGYQTDSKGCEICKCNNENEAELQAYNCENGIRHIDENRNIWSDGCRQCICQGGQQYCSLIACKKLDCLNPIYSRNSCCPTCQQKIESVVNTTICSTSKGNSYYENDIWQLDDCTKCACKNGIVFCEIRKCAHVNCLNPMFDKCECPYCSSIMIHTENYNTNLKTHMEIDSQQQLKYPSFAFLPSSTISLPSFDKDKRKNFNWSCLDSNNKYKSHGSVWKENDCINCVCNNGESKCFNFKDRCPNEQCIKQVWKKGQCCPSCLDSVSLPFLIFNQKIYNYTSPLMPTFIKKGSNLSVSSVINYILGFISLVLLFMVIFLLIKYINSHKKQSNRKNRCTLISSSNLSQSKFSHNKNNNNNNNNLIDDEHLLATINNNKKIPIYKMANNQDPEASMLTRNSDGSGVGGVGGDVTSPLLLNNFNIATSIMLNQNFNNQNLIHKHSGASSDTSESITNDDNSKSTLFTCSLDENQISQNQSKMYTVPLNIPKINPIDIYYC